MTGPDLTAATPSVPLSALEHWAYCPRQAGLILLEDSYAENADTVRGSLAHERVDAGETTTAPGLRQLRTLPVFSDRLGLHGVADLVEFAGRDVIPVEYKSGRYKPAGPADVQVAGQAMCLEEMFQQTIEVGYVFSLAERRRYAVTITDELRDNVAQTTAAVRRLLVDLQLGPAVDDGRCPGCSMHEVCMPRVVAARKAVSSAERALFDTVDEPV